MFSDLNVSAANKVLSALIPELVDLSIEFQPGNDGIVDLTVRGVKIRYGDVMKLRASSGEVRQMKCFSFNGKSCPAPLIDGKVQLRVLADRVSLELYVNGGGARPVTNSICARQGPCVVCQPGNPD